MDIDLDAVIAEATADVAPEAKATEVAPQAELTPEAPEEDVSSKTDDELTPEQLAKREANRESHRNSREAKLRRELRELREYRAQQEVKVAAPAQPVSDGRPIAPKESDFTTLMDYLEAKDKYQEANYEWKLEQKISELKPKEPVQVDTVQAERIQQIGVKALEFAKAVPEYKSLYQQNADFFEGMPKALEDAIYAADDAPLALYALMKEDRLLDLEGMSPQRMAIEIGRAEERGKSYLNSPKPVSNAPQPFPKAGRVTSGTKSLDNMSPDEILNLVRTT